ncbi:extracellular solute-binding protein [Sansalvadorimonas verongulae]|uniref:extracellular solute-binding protein n=1 Tax=Sansalvadorimonas verongulae TaxID=2172824 RepID=UPI0012BBCC81|nr:extracellular solute-binding protein [Sansalvadorimonas verongulae]MTI12872.1 ABC transporter substrate-binding protein [Sansalvadorimonas verongulae]
MTIIKKCSKSLLIASVFIFTIISSFALQAGELKHLPDGLNWINNSDQSSWADPQAKKGGVFYSHIDSYPLSLRLVGPNTNGTFARYARLVGNGTPLVQLQPNTRVYVPGLATEWAFAGDHRTVYFRLNPQARWSDGKKVTADDYLYTLKFMRSKNIVAPWYNNYYTQRITDVTKYDDYTISVTTGQQHDDFTLLSTASIPALPAHFYGNEVPEDYVRRYNWRTPPTTGPYTFGQLRMGNSIALERVKNWWAKDLKYYKHRFNADRIVFNVIRNDEVAWQHFLKGQLDTYTLILPEPWHNRINTNAFTRLSDNGYVQKLWFLSKAPAGLNGFFLNTEVPLLKNQKVREGLQYSFDFVGMSERLAFGEYPRMNTLGANHGKYTDTTLKAAPYDPAQARKLFAEAGFTRVDRDGTLMNSEGQRLELSVLYMYASQDRRMAFYREQAKKAGVDLKLQFQQGATGFKAVLEKNFEIVRMGWTTNLIPAYWEYFASENAKPQTNNITMTRDDELDKLIAQYRSTMDVEEKAQLSRNIQQRVAELAVFVPGYVNPNRREVAWRWVNAPSFGVTELSQGIFDITDGLFWIDPAKKKETLDAFSKNKKLTVIPDMYGPNVVSAQ